MSKIHHPEHYCQAQMETIDIIENALSEEAFEGFLAGNVMKYLARYKFKEQPRTDLAKALWYLRRILDLYLDGDINIHNSDDNPLPEVTDE